MFYAFPAS